MSADVCSSSHDSEAAAFAFTMSVRTPVRTPALIVQALAETEVSSCQRRKVHLQEKMLPKYIRMKVCCEDFVEPMNVRRCSAMSALEMLREFCHMNKITNYVRLHVSHCSVALLCTYSIVKIWFAHGTALEVRRGIFRELSHFKASSYVSAAASYGVTITFKMVAKGKSVQKKRPQVMEKHRRCVLASLRRSSWLYSVCFF